MGWGNKKVNTWRRFKSEENKIFSPPPNKKEYRVDYKPYLERFFAYYYKLLE